MKSVNLKKSTKVKTDVCVYMGTFLFKVVQSICRYSQRRRRISCTQRFSLNNELTINDIL